MRTARLLAAMPAVCLLISSPAAAAETLRWKWSKGDTQRYVMKQQMEMTINAGPAGQMKTSTGQQMVMNWTADEVDAEGAATLSQRFERISMKMSGPFGPGDELRHGRRSAAGRHGGDGRADVRGDGRRARFA